MTVHVQRRPRLGSGCVTVADASIRVEHSAVQLTFSEPRGFGGSQYELRVFPDSYFDLARAMMFADPDVAIRAFGAAMQSGIPEPKEHWQPSEAA